MKEKGGSNTVRTVKLLDNLSKKSSPRKRGAEGRTYILDTIKGHALGRMCRTILES